MKESLTPQQQPPAPTPQDNLEQHGGNKKVRVILTTLAIVIIVLSGAGYWFVTRGPGSAGIKKEMYNDNFSEGWKQLLSGNPESAIHFQDALNNATTPQEEAQAKLGVGGSRLYYGNKEEGARILKEVSVNESYPESLRAVAVNILLGYWNGTYDISLARDVLFVGEVWGDFLDGLDPQDPNSLSIGAFRAYGWSTELFSTFFAQYRVANAYAARLYDEKLSDKEKENVAAEALRRITLGDRALESTAPDLNKVVEVPGAIGMSDIGLGLTVKGSALIDLYENGYLEDAKLVEDTLQDAIDILIGKPDDRTAFGVSLYSRYHLAGFLARRNDESRYDGIRKILGPVVEAPINYPIFAFLAGQRNPQVELLSDPRGTIILLAQIDEAFKQKLLSNGWRQSDFEN